SSSLGTGSEFKVVLHFALASHEALAAQQSTPSAPGELALRGVRVLVVDDGVVNLHVAKRILEIAGAQVCLANDGQEAFDCLRAEPTTFDAVLMDVQMPVLDGHQATRRIRSELGLVDLPILALTAGALSSERERALVAGMNDFITKPFDPRQLVQSLLSHVKPANGQTSNPPNAAPRCLEAENGLEWPSIDGIDSADVRQRLGDDIDLFRSMLRRLLDEFSDIASSAAGQVPVSPANGAGRMHKLRGIAGMLGATVICRVAGEAEAAYAEGRVEEAGQLARRLQMELHGLRRSAMPLIVAAEPQVVPSSAVALDPRAVKELIDLLRRQSLNALDRFNSISPQLHYSMGDIAHRRVRTHIDNLRFKDAADALDETLQSGCPVPS
ncbi:MAG: response regulator, partial [Pseudomonadota bacterium]|nr:response regulator [Pseudomonadota bacterium]